MKTVLQRIREQRRIPPGPAHLPLWRHLRATAEIDWLYDGDCAVAMVHRGQDTFELRCAGPGQPCAPDVVPKYYHTPVYVGVRIIATWRLKGHGCGDRVNQDLAVVISPEGPVLTWTQHWADGSVSNTTLTLTYDRDWSAYVADVRCRLTARRATRCVEFCNVLPAGISESRLDRLRHPFTVWAHSDGMRKMFQNPLWFNSVGAQDATGQRFIPAGGFLGFGPDPVFNPVVELISSTPATGAMTCDNLQDEHLVVWPPDSSQVSRTGWYRLQAHYRLFSIPEAIARAVVEQADLMKPGPMLAWKFQYPAIAELPEDLTRVELPCSPFYGKSDWSQPASWDAPFHGRIWTASPDPRAAIHYDRQIGRERPGSIRLRVAGQEQAFAPATGHTLHLDEGVTYRYSIWIKTEGDATGWISLYEMLFNYGDATHTASAAVGPDSDWTQVEVSVTGRGQDAPFGQTMLNANGSGNVWFTDMAFEVV